MLILLYAQGGFLCVDDITNSSNIMEDLAMHQLVGLLPYKYILLPLQVVMMMY